jgi:ABC-type transport system substrate-binding protein
VVENDSTFIIKLVKPNGMFLHFLASPAAVVFPKEAYNAYKTNLTVGMGPFYVFKYPENGNPLILCRNSRYFELDNKGNCLPYLDTVKIYFIGSLRTQLEMLKNGKLDVVLNIDNETMSSFLEQNIKLVEGVHAPFKVLSSNADEASPVQHIIRSTIQNFNINSQNQFDLTEVKIQKDTVAAK